MSTPKSEFLKVIQDRGYLHQCTDWDALDALAAKQPVTAYVGFDATADSLHVGHMVQIMLLRRLQQTGHRPIALMGGGTTKVGDPSGKDESRKLLTVEDINRNLDSIKQSFQGYLTFGGGRTEAIMVNNADWLERFSFIEFLRDVGKHVTVNYMLAKESVRSRLEEREQGISFTEFTYMLLQAWDFVHLSRAHGCRLQLGGSDQWGNITAGCELQRKLGGPQLYGMTMPLLLDSSGQKMGKTSSGQRVWLDPALTTPYAFYQYWHNVSDVDAGRFLKTFSWRPLPEILEIIAVHGRDPGKRLGQRTLAEDLGTWVHGAEAIRRAAAASQVMFGGAVTDLADADLEALIGEVPSTDVPLSRLDAGVPLLDLLVETGLCSSKGDARRKISQGGIYLNQQRVESADLVLHPKDRATESFVLLRSGKKEYRLIRVR